MENQNIDMLKSGTHSGFSLFPFFSKKQAGFLIAIIAAVFYSPSFNNEYALDDDIVIHQNDFVLKGVRGIGDIFGKNLYHAFYRRMNAQGQLQGGRYRPLTTATFALEQEIIGPYRSGRYLMAEDLNKNGVLDDDQVIYSPSRSNTEIRYEYNNYIDLNNDGVAQLNECYACWDLNRNFKNDPSEDLNVDGLFNEVDCQVYGASLRHMNNILLYSICCLLLYLFFANHIFRDKPDLAFLAALLFTIHPANSEMVANVKGRDSIVSLIFVLLSLIFAFRYYRSSGIKDLLFCAGSVFAGLLSKEESVTLFALIPLSLYMRETLPRGYFSRSLAPS